MEDDTQRRGLTEKKGRNREQKRKSGQAFAALSTFL